MSEENSKNLGCGFEMIDAYLTKPEMAQPKLPVRKTHWSAGYDFFTPVETVIPAHGSAVIRTGIRAYMSEDMFLALLCGPVWL